jgi:hypothetical protein
MPWAQRIVRHETEVASCPVVSTDHLPTKDHRTADACAYRDSNNIPVPATRAVSHLARQDRICVVVAHNRTREPVAELHGERDSLEELKLALQPDHLARREVDPPRAPNTSSRNSDRGAIRQSHNLAGNDFEKALRIAAIRCLEDLARDQLP